jgi:hypothetical protein
MTQRVRAHEIVRWLGLEEDLLARLRSEGLFEHEELAFDEAEELRVAALLMHDLGVNPAGVEVALQLRRRLLSLEARMRDVLERLLDERGAP